MKLFTQGEALPAPTGMKLPQFCCERKVSDSCMSGFTANQMLPAFPQASHCTETCFPLQMPSTHNWEGRFPSKCLIFISKVWERTSAEIFHLAMMGKSWNFSNYWISRKVPEGWEAAATLYLVIKCNSWVKLQWWKRRLARGFQVSLLWSYAQGLLSRSY